MGTCYSKAAFWAGKGTILCIPQIPLHSLPFSPFSTKCAVPLKCLRTWFRGLIMWHPNFEVNTKALIWTMNSLLFSLKEEENSVCFSEFVKKKSLLKAGKIYVLSLEVWQIGLQGVQQSGKKKGWGKLELPRIHPQSPTSFNQPQHPQFHSL